MNRLSLWNPEYFMKKPALNISVFSDYICPFCYIGHLRLEALRERYDLKINWCFIEIHPETSAQGQSIDSLNYSHETWKKLMDNLQKLAAKENITFCKQIMTTNSRQALLLSQEIKSLGADVFYPFHQQLFSDYFINGKNIGDEDVLRDIAQQHNIPKSTIDKAWQDKYTHGPANATPDSLLPFLKYAGKLQTKSVPSFIIGNQVLTGAVSKEALLTAAEKQIKSNSSKTL